MPIKVNHILVIKPADENMIDAYVSSVVNYVQMKDSSDEDDEDNEEDIEVTEDKDGQTIH